MLLAGVVHDQIEDDSHSAFVYFLNQPVAGLHVAILLRDAAIVADVIAEILLRTAEEGRDPNRTEPQFLDVVQSADDAIDVPDAISIRILKRPRVDLIDSLSLPSYGLPNQSAGNE